MEITNIKGGTYAILSPANVGLYVKNGAAMLIDSGSDPSAGRKILRLAEAEGWDIKLIVNTHFHADHIGGNAFIQKRTGCAIAASERETPYINFPEMEPCELWSGTAPQPLQTKFLRAEPSKVGITLADGDIIEEFGAKIVALPGHAHGQIGVLTEDGVLFTADAVIAERILEKYGIPFTADYDKAMSTFALLEEFKADIFIPAHGDLCKDIVPLVKANRDCLSALRAEITEICSKPHTRDDILAELASRRGLEVNLPQYALNHSTISAILTPLLDSGELKADFQSGTLKIIRS